MGGTMLSARGNERSGWNDDTPRKLMRGDRLRTLGWGPRIGLREGIEDVYRAFLAEIERYYTVDP